MEGRAAGCGGEGMMWLALMAAGAAVAVEAVWIAALMSEGVDGPWRPRHWLDRH